MPADTLRQRIHDAWNYREALGLATEADGAFRLVNGRADGLPGLTVDVYGSYALMHLYDADNRAGVTELSAALLTLPRIAGVYAVDRRSPAETKLAEPLGHIAGEPAPEHQTIVTEHGLRYEIHLDEGPATGLYLDQRENRRQAARLAAGEAFLNTFSYTCSFSVAAAHEGSVTENIDLSKTALDWGKRNFSRNALPAADHRFVPEDVFAYARRLSKRGSAYGVVLLDPPTFARGKKGVFSTERDYGKLVRATAPLVQPGGYLIAFANTHRMGRPQWEAALQSGLDEAELHFTPVDQWGQSPDFRWLADDPAGLYLKNWVLRRHP